MICFALRVRGVPESIPGTALVALHTYQVIPHTCRGPGPCKVTPSVAGRCLAWTYVFRISATWGCTQWGAHLACTRRAGCVGCGGLAWHWPAAEGLRMWPLGSPVETRQLRTCAHTRQPGSRILISYDASWCHLIGCDGILCQHITGHNSRHGDVHIRTCKDMHKYMLARRCTGDSLQWDLNPRYHAY